MLERPAVLNVVYVVVVGELVKELVVLLDCLLKCLHLLLSEVLGALNELSQLNELFFILWALSNALLHVVKC